MKTVFASLNKRTPVDLFVAGFFEKEKVAKEIEALEPEFAKLAGLALEKKRFEGKFQDLFSSYSPNNKEAAEVVLFGLGQRKNHKKMCFRKAVSHIIKIAQARKAKTVRLLLSTFTNDVVKLEDAVQIAAEYANLASYDFDRHKSKKEDQPCVKVETLELVVSSKPTQELKESLAYGDSVSQGNIFARDLINEPGNVMTAEKIAELAKEMADQKGLSCEIIDQSEIEQLKMGGIVAVNQGSTTPAKLVILEYGARHKKNGTICLVGKGVTFDTGGISIKPAKDMEKMKYDMSGAAAVISTMRVIGDLKPKVHVVALAPCVENNVANNPIRPGDIIRMFNGKSVEVINTDAEGRLILADALSYCAKYQPKAIIDLATLTGMCAYTFGDKAIGLMTNDEKFGEKVKKAGENTGERCWELPMWDEYAQQIKGHHSDLLNVGGSYGGTITAAKVLQEFIPEKTAWVHLDIAGTAWCDSPRYDAPKGATGIGVRLLTDLITNWK